MLGKLVVDGTPEEPGPGGLHEGNPPLVYYQCVKVQASILHLVSKIRRLHRFEVKKFK